MVNPRLKLTVKPIEIPSDVQVDLKGNSILVKGPLGEISREFPKNITISYADNTVYIKRDSDEKFSKAIEGTTRALISNFVEGVTKGFSKTLELSGIGFRANLEDKVLTLLVGFSHPIKFEAPVGVSFEVKENKIKVFGVDKQLVGDTAARIKKVRKPDPYKGKGIKYEGEIIKKKVGKTAKLGAGEKL